MLDSQFIISLGNVVQYWPREPIIVGDVLYSWVAESGDAGDLAICVGIAVLAR